MKEDKICLFCAKEPEKDCYKKHPSWIEKIEIYKKRGKGGKMNNESFIIFLLLVISGILLLFMLIQSQANVSLLTYMETCILN